MNRLAKLYAEKKKELGQTGAGLQNPDQIDNGSESGRKLFNLWGRSILIQRSGVQKVNYNIPYDI